MKFLPLLIAVFALAAARPAAAGTMIYKNREGEQRILTNVKLLSIDGRLLVFSINSGTDTMPLSSLVKYYDTNIKSAEQFDDNTADYTLSFTSVKHPDLIREQDKSPEFTFDYTISRKPGEPQTAIRAPYFYLFVLTTNAGGERSLHSYALPDKAKTSMRRYDEARMLEKVIALERPTVHDRDTHNMDRIPGKKKNRIGTKSGTVKLTGIKNAKIIAYYLVGWNKSELCAEKKWTAPGYQVSKLWWYR